MPTKAQNKLSYDKSALGNYLDTLAAEIVEGLRRARTRIVLMKRFPSLTNEQEIRDLVSGPEYSDVHLHILQTKND